MMQRISIIFLLISQLVLLTLAGPAGAGEYRFTVKGEQVLLNDRPFKVIGLRLSNALISDDTAGELIKNLDVFKGYGVNTVSVFVMGSRFGDVKGYKPDATLDPVVAARLGSIIEAADRRGMVVLVGCLYWSTSKASEDLGAWTQEDANTAVANTVAWLSRHDYRNVFVDVDNEGMAHKARNWDIGKMIDAAHAADASIMVAHNSNEPPPANADLLVHHSPVVKGRPWIQSEGTSGDYWGGYSRTKDDYYNYIRIGRYPLAMKQQQLRETHTAITDHAGYMLASTWLQCPPAERIGGPFMNPGGLATGNADEPPLTRVQPDAGILWWLRDVKTKYGEWVPPTP
jgi:hypothetical protein